LNKLRLSEMPGSIPLSALTPEIAMQITPHAAAPLARLLALIAAQSTTPEPAELKEAV
jgi:hypothetical protein